MSTRPFVCPDCGANGVKRFAESVSGDQVIRSASYHCDSCGSAEEADGVDLPPDIREDFLREEGLWGIRLAAGSDEMKALSLLRKSLGLRPSEMLARKKRGSLAEGTRAEMSCLKEVLEIEKVSAETFVIRSPESA